MKLDDIEKLIEAASPAPWPAEFGCCGFPDEGSMACGPIITLDEDEDEECRQAQADQDFICMARLVMPKLLRVAVASTALDKRLIRDLPFFSELTAWRDALADAVLSGDDVISGGRFAGNPRAPL